MKMIIYKATNLINGKFYIGLTTKTLKERLKGNSYTKIYESLNIGSKPVIRELKFLGL